MKQLTLEALTLASARGRLASFSVLSAAIYLSHYHWLDHLSLWGNLGFSRAPSIGLTRAYWLLLHGQPGAAWHRNWLIYIVLAVGIPLLLKDLAALLAQRLDRSISAA